MQEREMGLFNRSLQLHELLIFFSTRRSTPQSVFGGTVIASPGVKDSHHHDSHTRVAPRHQDGKLVRGYLAKTTVTCIVSLSNLYTCCHFTSRFGFYFF